MYGWVDEHACTALFPFPPRTITTKKQELDLFLVNSYGDLFDLEHRFPSSPEVPPGLFRCVSRYVCMFI